jgi:ADP-ribose pyrophosphatase
MVEYRTLSTRYVHRGHVNLRIDTVTTPGGQQAAREIVEHPDCVAIVPVDADGNILMVRQYRQAAGKTLLEIPAGGIDPGEDPVAAVKREMGEETGFSPRTVRRLGGFYSSPGFCTEFMHLFLVTDLVPNRLVAEDTDEIELVPTRPDELADLIQSGTICDSKSVAGILMYLSMIR